MCLNVGGDRGAALGIFCLCFSLLRRIEIFCCVEIREYQSTPPPCANGRLAEGVCELDAMAASATVMTVELG